MEVEMSPLTPAYVPHTGKSLLNERTLSSWKRILVKDPDRLFEQQGSICSLLAAQNGIPRDVDVIAMTGAPVDLTMFRDLLSCYSPKLVSVKFNPYYNPTQSVTSEITCSLQWDELRGASLRSYEAEAYRRGYDLVGLENCGSLMFVSSGTLPSPASRPFTSRYNSATETMNCPLNMFFSELELHKCVLQYNIGALQPDPSPAQPSSYRDLTVASIGARITLKPAGADGTRDELQEERVLNFAWNRSVFKDGSSSAAPDFIGVAHGISGAIRTFLEDIRDTTDALRDRLVVYREVIEELKRKYPRMFATMTGLVGDMDSAFAISCLNSGTDKFHPHGYYRYYARYVHQYMPLLKERNSFSLLEIGIQGGHSVNMWLQIFPENVFLYGLDIQNGFVGDKYLIFHADQASLDNMTYIKKYILNSLYHDVFLIIDDGSHRPEHQIASFDYFFAELLLLGGTYIIEDVETSYWRAEYTPIGAFHYGYKYPTSAIEIFKHLADEVNYEFLSESDRERHDKLLSGHFSEKTRRLISTVTFGQNCMIIVKKSAEDVIMYNDRKYRFSKLTEPYP